MCERSSSGSNGTSDVVQVICSAWTGLELHIRSWLLGQGILEKHFLLMVLIVSVRFRHAGRGGGTGGTSCQNVGTYVERTGFPTHADLLSAFCY